MRRKDQRPLSERIAQAAAQALAGQGTVTLIDVLTGIHWLDPGAVKRWRTGMLDCLEEAVQPGPARFAQGLKEFHKWTAEQGLVAADLHFVARTPERQALRVSRTGDPATEAAFHKQYAPPSVSEAKREQLAETASRPPDLVVIDPHNQDWKCHRCGETGDLLIMEKPGPCCLRCAGLADLVFLGRGDALLTRRARAKSARSAVVVRFSRARKRYERQGLLVEDAALQQAEQEIAAQRQQNP